MCLIPVEGGREVLARLPVDGDGKPTEYARVGVYHSLDRWSIDGGGYLAAALGEHLGRCREHCDQVMHERLT